MTVLRALSLVVTGVTVLCAPSVLISAKAGAQERPGCVVPPDARPFTIAVIARGAVVDTSVLRQAAGAIANEWGVPPEAYDASEKEIAIWKELRERIQKPSYRTFGAWKPERGDSAAALLTYRAGDRPEIAILTPAARWEMKLWARTAIQRAIEEAALGRAHDDTLPLTLPGGAVEGAGLEVHFGFNPPDGSAVAVFSTVERDVSQILRTVFLPYPEEMRSQGIEGEAKLAFIVKTNGRVETSSVRVIHSSKPAFADAARHAVLRARYLPFSQNCHTLPMVVVQPFNFRLDY